MIYIGDKKVKACYLGDVPIGKVYLGDELLFNSKNTYTITASIDPAGSGAVTGAGRYQEGASVTLTAAPGEDYKFVAWTENGQTVSGDAEYTFTATADRELVAVFAIENGLPGDYTQVEYVQVDYLTRLNTGAETGEDPSNIRLVMDITPTSFGNYYPQFLFAANDIYNGSGYTLRLVNQSNSMLYQLGVNTTGTTNFTYKFIENNRIIIDSDPKNSVLKIGNSSFAVLDGYFSNWLSGAIYIGTSSTFSRYSTFNMKIYSFQVYKGEYLMCDLVPCKNSSGTPGFYDLVSHEFKMAERGNPTAGPAV